MKIRMRQKNTLEDVDGAPYLIGARVQVVKGTDETFDKAFLKRVGYVTYFNYNCGCGQTYPHDPMIGVEFPNGVTEEFWREELKLKPLSERMEKRNRSRSR